MLFPYTYVPHQMEKMQAFIDFIFYEVWCKAPASGPFGLHLFAANAELHEVMEAFYYSDTQGADFFYSHVERIYSLFSALNVAQINQFQHWYQGNNDIEKVCANDPAAHPIRYDDIAVNHKKLADQLGTFFKGLYSKSLLGLAALRNKIGDIDDHYHAFITINNVGKCPFCGISDLFGQYHSKREAYDHYLPKTYYPFNSINFKNLVPACHHCNSSYKTTHDPTYTPKDPVGTTYRRSVFFPFTTNRYVIELQVTLHHSNISNLKPADIDLDFGPAELDEKISTWKDVYGIEERYKARICGDGVDDGKFWMVQVLDEWKEDGRHPADFLKTLTRQTRVNPYSGCNFLKKSFLDACSQRGLFDI